MKSSGIVDGVACALLFVVILVVMMSIGLAMQSCSTRTTSSAPTTAPAAEVVSDK